MELAVADLNDKDTLILSYRIRKLVQEIHENHDLFISNRQLLSVLIISCIAILTDKAFKGFDVPFFDYPKDALSTFHTADNLSTFVVKFLFINLTILWFCQICPKQIAARNSELFLDRSKYFWPMIRTVGLFSMDGPAKEITRFSARAMKVPPRLLPPSRATLYSVGTKIIGLATDQIKIKISLNSDGSADVSRHYLIIYAHGRHQSIRGSLSYGGNDLCINLDDVNIEVLDLVILDIVEDMRVYETYLDRSFRDRSFHRDARVSKSNWKFTIKKIHGQNSNVVTWHIKSTKDLPEGFWPPPLRMTPEEDDGIKKFVAVIYSVKATAPAASFTTPRDFWKESFLTAPCRRVEFEVTNSDLASEVKYLPLEVAFANLKNELREEKIRYDRSFNNSRSINYPVPGCVVTFTWETLKVSELKATYSDDTMIAPNDVH